MITDTVAEAYELLILTSFDGFFIEDTIPHSHDSGIMGFQLLRKIRNMHPYQFTPIFFFTKLEGARTIIYEEFHCYSCLEYPFDLDSLSRDINHLISCPSYMHEKQDVYFRQDGQLIHIPAQEIVYCECKRERLLLYLYQKPVEVFSYHSCQQILNLLNSPDFIQCSKSTIINRRYIASINEHEKNLLLQSVRKPIPIGSYYQKQLLQSITILSNYYTPKSPVNHSNLQNNSSFLK